MEDEDAVPQDLSYKSQVFNFNNHFGNLNGHNQLLENILNNSCTEIQNATCESMELSPHMAKTFINGTSNASLRPMHPLSNVEMPIDLAADKYQRNSDDAQPQSFIDTANILNCSVPVDQTINLKRKHNDHTDASRSTEQSNSVSPKHIKLFRPYSDDKYQVPLNANCVQSGGLQALLNPSVFKSTDEMKYFLKHQLQFSDLGKLFGNVDFSASGEHLGEYAQFLGLQPSVKFKCFKCDKSSFLSLAELKEHQTICLKNGEKTTQTQHDTTINHNNSNSADTATVENSTINDSSGSNQTKQQISDTKIRITRKVFLCSACGTYYENWNLFHHMREVHNKFICLHCLGIFQSADRLVHHLETKHTAKPNVYEHKEQLLAAIKDQCYLMCCVCEHIFSEHDDFTSHSCENYIQPCALCGLKFIHRPNCQASMQMMNKQIRHKDRDKGKTKVHPDSSGPKSKKDYRQRKSNVNSHQGDANRFDVKQSQDVNLIVNGFDKSSLQSNVNIRQPPDVPHSIAAASHQLHMAPPQIGNDKQNLTDLHSWIPTQHMSELEKLQSLFPHPVATAIVNNNNNANKESSQMKTTLKHRDSIRDSLGAQEDYLDARDMDVLNGFINEDFAKIENKVYGIGDGNRETKDVFVSNGVYNNTTDDHDDNSSCQLDEDDDDEGEEDVEDENNDDYSSFKKDESMEKPLLVPKLKLKISKQFQKPIESEESSTESDDEVYIDADQNEDGDETPPDPELAITSVVLKENEEDIQPSSPKQNEVIPASMEEDDKCMPADPNEIEKEKLDVTEIQEPVEERVEDVIVAGDEVYTVELLLKQPLDKIHIKDFLKICLNSSYPVCLYCNHARKIAVDGHSLALHLISQHRFSATVDSITAEELHPSTIVQRIKSGLDELNDIYFNLNSYDSSDKNDTMPYDKVYECFQCRFQSSAHKELYLHNRKMHLKSILMCLMCKANFYSYSELVCHMCPGSSSKLVVFDLTFRCVLCNLDQIPSAFRLMVHLRKKHFACDVCLEECQDQSKLSSHVWKHKLHHLCYRCGIAYRNKPDITKHLFWKHGTESVLCKRCLQKKWPHVYHFCIPPSTFVCEICNLSFSKAVALKVHKRIHTEDAPYPCTEDGCDKKFISRKLLLKHVQRHSMPVEPEPIVEPIVQEIEKIEEPEEEPPATIKNETDEAVASADAKQKTKKAKKNKSKDETSTSNLMDIINMPAPNLSESDSSDESDNENTLSKPMNIEQPDVLPDPTIDASVIDDDENKPAPIVDIWENFKTYQASQVQDKFDDDDDLEPPQPPILHVAQSDHDYCLMYKVLNKSATIDDDLEKPEEVSEANLNEITEKALLEISNEQQPPVAKPIEKPVKNTSPKKGRSPKKGIPKSATESSSDSSDSGSSCSCGSNCSCSTSSGSSSSSSSSSDDSDSDTSEKRKKKTLKKEKRDRLKSENSFKANLSDNIDVVTADKPVSRDPDTIIFESDLETDESETDEDFYDEHPQKLASQILAEKRRQLMMQTSMNPLNNYDIVENSRPSTPSLPEEVVKQKKVKAKKRKKDRKNSSKCIPPLKINIPLNTITKNQIDHIEPNGIATQQQQSIDAPPKPTEKIKGKQLGKAQKIVTPGNININKPRLSTGSSCSDMDTPLKRSKRRRIPNKFYGYTSDEEDHHMNMTNSTIVNAFKPQPPPNLTWRKEDLPRTPTVARTPPIKTVIKIPPAYKAPAPPSPRIEYKTVSPAPVIAKVPVASTPPLVVPPIIIRPNRVVQPPPPPPPPIETRVPAVPVHHIVPLPIQQDSEQSADSSDSDSSEEGALQISAAAAAPPPLPLPLPPQQLPSLDSKTKNSNSQQTVLPVPIPQTIPHPQQLPHHIASNLLQQQQPLPSIQPSYPPLPPHVLPDQIRYPIMPPAGCRPAREGESVYCYCRCPYDEVSEMIACDGTDCPIEWFHFECVNIMVPPKGTWYCPQCRPKYINDKQQQQQQQQHFQDIT